MLRDAKWTLQTHLTVLATGLINLKQASQQDHTIVSNFINTTRMIDTLMYTLMLSTLLKAREKQ